MVFWIASVAGLAIAYLFGSTPTGYLAGKLLKGIDIREHGSKSIGPRTSCEPWESGLRWWCSW